MWTMMGKVSAMTCAVILSTCLNLCAIFENELQNGGIIHGE
jgi:hypothetical protein